MGTRDLRLVCMELSVTAGSLGAFELAWWPIIPEAPEQRDGENSKIDCQNNPTCFP